jgi:hypothetical protein
MVEPARQRRASVWERLFPSPLVRDRSCHTLHHAQLWVSHALPLDFDRRLMLRSHGAVITVDAGLLALCSGIADDAGSTSHQQRADDHSATLQLSQPSIQ